MFQEPSMKEPSKPAHSQTKEQRPRSHIVPDPYIYNNTWFNPLDLEIIFGDESTDPDRGFMHNNMTASNIIGDNGKISGLVDWETAGWFGWATAGEIHRRIRSPQCEGYVNAGLSENELEDLLFWNNLYDWDFREE